MKKFIAGFLLLGLLLITSCASKSPKVTEDPWPWKWIYKEISRVESPDGKVDAVMIEGDVGAVAATRTYIYIVPHNAKIADDDLDDIIFTGDYVENLKLVWNKWRRLEIHYDEARILKFQNYWENKKVDDYHYEVDIEFAPGKDYSLPLNLRTW